MSCCSCRSMIASEAWWYVTPEQFGADGTEKGDSYAFAKLTDFLRKKYARPRVRLAARTYKLSAGLNWTDFNGLTVEGVSREKSNLHIKSPFGEPSMDLTGTGRTTFRDFRITGDALAVPSCHILQARSSSNIDGAGEHLWERIYTTGFCSVMSVVNISHEISTYTQLRIRPTGGGSVAGLYVAKRPNLVQAMGVDSPNVQISSIYSCTNNTYSDLIITAETTETDMAPVVIEDGVGLTRFTRTWVGGFSDKGMYFKGNDLEKSAAYGLAFKQFCIEQPKTNVYGIWADTKKTWSRIDIENLDITGSTGVEPKDAIKWTGSKGGFQDSNWKYITVNTNSDSNFGLDLRTFQSGRISNISKANATLKFANLRDSEVMLSTAGQSVAVASKVNSRIFYPEGHEKAGEYRHNGRSYENWSSKNITADPAPSVADGNIFSLITSESNSDITNFSDGIDGQLITVRNSSFGKTITIKHEPGKIDNTSGSDLVLTYKQCAVYALFGANWSQVR